MINALSTALSGLLSATQKVDNSAARIASIGDGRGQDTLTEDIVDLKVGDIAYKANVAVIETVDELSDELLNLFDEEV